MRKSGLFCFIVSAILGLCIVSSTTGEMPGDRLVEVFKKDIKPKESLIPAGVIIAKDFEPGRGKAIGTVKAIKGQVLTIHRDEKTAYILKKGNELFTYDTLITEKDSKAQAEFNDGSIITLASYTKIVLDKSVYDPAKSTRDSLAKLLFGKARFIVTKLVNFRNSQFKVNTPTAVLGVRGSDFAVSVAYGSPLITTLMTGKDTTVVFTGDKPPAQVIGPMSTSSSIAGGAPTPPSGISVYDISPFKIAGVPDWAYWAGGGAAAIAAGFAVLSDSDSESGPAVSYVNPPKEELIPALSAITTFTFLFSKPITSADGTVSDNEFVLTLDNGADNWSIVTGSGQQTAAQTVEVQVTNPDSIPLDGFTLTLVNFQDSAGNPLEAPTSFHYNEGG